jgi:hypothetical protein
MNLHKIALLNQLVNILFSKQSSQNSESMKFHEVSHLDPPKFQNIVWSEPAYHKRIEMEYNNSNRLELKNFYHAQPGRLLQNISTSDYSLDYKLEVVTES